ncbi:MAG TPA: TSUP family transporter, partial [Pelovirga sp.]|nr:TSUP family transporter [Pelovirga sp.]
AVAPYSIGYVNWLVVLLVAPVTIICARLGVRFAGRTSQTKLIRIFAVVLMLIGVKIVFNL